MLRYLIFSFDELLRWVRIKNPEIQRVPLLSAAVRPAPDLMAFMAPFGTKTNTVFEQKVPAGNRNALIGYAARFRRVCAREIRGGAESLVVTKHLGTFLRQAHDIIDAAARASRRCCAVAVLGKPGYPYKITTQHVPIHTNTTCQYILVRIGLYWHMLQCLPISFLGSHVLWNIFRVVQPVFARIYVSPS